MRLPLRLQLATIGLWDPIPIPFLSSNLLVAWANSLHLEQRFIALIVVVAVFVVVVAAFVDSPATVAVLCCAAMSFFASLRYVSVGLIAD